MTQRQGRRKRQRQEGQKRCGGVGGRTQRRRRGKRRGGGWKRGGGQPRCANLTRTWGTQRLRTTRQRGLMRVTRTQRRNERNRDDSNTRVVIGTRRGRFKHDGGNSNTMGATQTRRGRFEQGGESVELNNGDSNRLRQVGDRGEWAHQPGLKFLDERTCKIPTTRCRARRRRVRPNNNA